ncbi:MAG: HAD family hydrolase [Candidatus Binatia bacterium]
MARSLRAVIFDVDGTLVTDSLHLEKHNFVMTQVLQKPQLSFTATEWHSLRGLTDEDTYRYIVRKAATYDVDLVQCLPERSYLAAARSYFDEHLHRVEVREGARAVIAVAEQLGLLLGVATNADWSETDKKLSVTGLKRHFGFFSVLGGVVAPKPAPDLYLQGIRAVRDCLGGELAPSQVMAIEDTVVGARAAQRAGCRVVLWPLEGNEQAETQSSLDPEAVLIADSVDDCISYLSTLSGCCLGLPW